MQPNDRVRIADPYEDDEARRRASLLRPVLPIVSRTLILINAAIFVLAVLSNWWKEGDPPIYRLGWLTSYNVLYEHQ